MARSGTLVEEPSGQRPAYEPREDHLARVVVVVLFVLSAVLGLTAQAADAGSTSPTTPAASTEQPASAAKVTPGLPRVTIEAKERQAVRGEVDKFVTSVVVQPWDDALYRWNKPICPLVAGLPKNFGEFILERVSKAAVDAHAPLAGKECHPNLYIVATDYPDLLLKKWWARDRVMYDFNDTGIEAIEHFIHSQRPIRVWYNTFISCEGGPGSARAFLGPSAIVPVCSLQVSRILRSSTGSNISSAIVVIDLRRMKKMTIGQMADYIALVSLADVRLDADPGSTPSILQLFAHGTPPQALTVWDRALLYSLYHTSAWSKLQLPELETTMVRHVAP